MAELFGQMLRCQLAAAVSDYKYSHLTAGHPSEAQRGGDSGDKGGSKSCDHGETEAKEKEAGQAYNPLVIRGCGSGSF
ncbi:MAG: hypothetical protein ABSA40_04605 [Candidatus Dormibacteria bacterium]|jgi:hypothetical protein